MAIQAIWENSNQLPPPFPAPPLLLQPQPPLLKLPNTFPPNMSGPTGWFKVNEEPIQGKKLKFHNLPIDLLLNIHSPLNVANDKKVHIKGFHNMSTSFKPDIHTQKLLSKGLKFIPTPKPLEDKDIHQDFSDFKGRLTVKAFIQEEVEKGNPHFTNHKLPPMFYLEHPPSSSKKLPKK